MTKRKAKSKTKKRQTVKPKKSKARSKKIKEPERQKVIGKVCPHCGVKASAKQIETVFGWRNMGDMVRPQTYCRKCRSKHAVEMRTLKGRKKALIGLDLREKENRLKAYGKPSQDKKRSTGKKRSAIPKKDKGKKTKSQSKNSRGKNTDQQRKTSRDLKKSPKNKKRSSGEKSSKNRRSQ